MRSSRSIYFDLIYLITVIRIEKLDLMMQHLDIPEYLIKIIVLFENTILSIANTYIYRICMYVHIRQTLHLTTASITSLKRMNHWFTHRYVFRIYYLPTHDH